MSALSALKELDQAKYLACLYVPDSKREAFAALNAFAAELQRIPKMVSEPLPGEIRLQWWREIVSGERTGETLGHPIAEALLAAIAEYRLPSAPLEAMVDARIFDLYHDPMPDIAMLETYLGETESVLIQFGSLILDPVNHSQSAEAAGHAGMAIGIANILRHLSRTTSQQKIYVPASILNATGSTSELIFAGDASARKNAATAMVALGRDHLKSFKRLGKSISPQLRPAFLGVPLCEPIFRKVEKLGEKAFVSEVSLSPLLVTVRQAYRAMRGW